MWTWELHYAQSMDWGEQTHTTPYSLTVLLSGRDSEDVKRSPLHWSVAGKSRRRKKTWVNIYLSNMSSVSKIKPKRWLIVKIFSKESQYLFCENFSLVEVSFSLTRTFSQKWHSWSWDTGCCHKAFSFLQYFLIQQTVQSSYSFETYHQITLNELISKHIPA